MQVSPDQALVLLSGVFVFFIHMGLGGMVSRARNTFGIKLPNLYETPDSEGRLKTPFNSYQRAHMNMVENLAVFYFLLFGAALFNPFHAAISGFVWGFGRIVYAIGYTYDPKKRAYGEFFMLATFYQVFLICYGCYKVLIK